MAGRTIKVDMDRKGGKMLIAILNDDERLIGCVTVLEAGACEQSGACWEAQGGDGGPSHHYHSIEMAFRNAIMSVVDVVTEDLLPTESR